MQVQGERKEAISLMFNKNLLETLMESRICLKNHLTVRPRQIYLKSEFKGKHKKFIWLPAHNDENICIVLTKKIIFYLDCILYFE